jgi:hypothetical protein
MFTEQFLSFLLYMAKLFSPAPPGGTFHCKPVFVHKHTGCATMLFANPGSAMIRQAWVSCVTEPKGLSLWNFVWQQLCSDMLEYCNSVSGPFTLVNYFMQGCSCNCYKGWNCWFSSSVYCLSTLQMLYSPHVIHTDCQNTLFLLC